MSIYKQAAQVKLRFATPRGILSVEQLWDLNMLTLSTVIRELKKLLSKNTDEELSFLDDTVQTKEQKENELRFNILKDIYTSKKEADLQAKAEIEKKEHNQKILQLIASKQEEALSGKSIEELEKMLK